MKSKTHLRTPRAPHSTLEGISLSILPHAVHRFMFSQSEELQVAHLVVRALFGGLIGAVLFLGVCHNLPLTFNPWLTAGCVFTGFCVVGGALSPSCMCSLLLMFPSMLGSNGRAYLMLLILSVLCKGPLSNIGHNMETAALSLSCNLDLQVHHSKLLWRDAIRPFILITEELMGDEAELQSETMTVSRKFQDIRDEVILQYGYDRFKHRQDIPTGSNTQEQFTAKTMMQCDNVVDEGVQRCAGWFNTKWAECMEAIPVPIINHILCVSMKFHFLCDVMRVMTPWCREQIPVEGNFGQLFDQLSTSVDLLSKEFSTEFVLQEEQRQTVFGGAVLDEEFTQAVRENFQKLNRTLTQVLDVLQLMLSFTCITVFTKAFGYLRSYRKDIRFDNVYITTYFRQIDARRERAGKRHLLPLKEPEKKKLIDVKSLYIHPKELKQVTSGLFQVLSVILLSFVLFTLDFSLFHVLDIVSRHTFTQLNLTSSHQVDIKVGGDSMLARLLRKTVSAFNSSSTFDIRTDNQKCVSPPSSLSAGVYISCVVHVLLLVVFTCLQVYTNRLRRAIVAFYRPKREKKRVLFLYNLWLQRRMSSDKKQTNREEPRRRTVSERLNRWWSRLCHCQEQEVSDSEETHYSPG